MRIVIAALATLTTSADADPATATTATNEGQLALAVRFGGETASYNWDGNTEANGRGWMADAELGWRTPWWSIAALSTYASVEEAGSLYDSYPAHTYDLHVRTIDLGARASLHYRGIFAGVGIALNVATAKGTYTLYSDAVPAMPPTTASYSSHWVAGKMYEMHVGYTFPRIAACHCAVQAIGMYTLESVQFTDSDAYDLAAWRLAVGLQF